MTIYSMADSNLEQAQCCKHDWTVLESGGEVSDVYVAMFA